MSIWKWLLPALLAVLLLIGCSQQQPILQQNQSNDHSSSEDETETIDAAADSACILEAGSIQLFRKLAESALIKELPALVEQYVAGSGLEPSVIDWDINLEGQYYIQTDNKAQFLYAFNIVVIVPGNEQMGESVRLFSAYVESSEIDSQDSVKVDIIPFGRTQNLFDYIDDKYGMSASIYEYIR